MVKTKRKYSKRQNKKNKSRKMKRKSNRKKSINKKGGFIETLSGIGTTYVVPIAGRILSIAFLAFLSMYFKGKISQTNETLKQPEYIQAAANKKAAKTDSGIFPANRIQNVEGTSKSSMLKDKLGSLSIPKPNMPQLGQQSLPEVQGEVLQEVQGEVLQEVQGQVVEQPQEQPTPGAKDAIVGNIQENLEAAKNAAGDKVTPPPGMTKGDGGVPPGAQGTTKPPTTGAQMAAKERNETGLDFKQTTALQKKAQKAKEKTAAEEKKKAAEKAAKKEKEKIEVGEKKKKIKQEEAKIKGQNNASQMAADTRKNQQQQKQKQQEAKNKLKKRRREKGKKGKR